MTMNVINILCSKNVTNIRQLFSSLKSMIQPTKCTFISTRLTEYFEFTVIIHNILDYNFV